MNEEKVEPLTGMSYKKLAYLSQQMRQLSAGMKVDGQLALYTVTYEEVNLAAHVVEKLVTNQS